MNTIKVVQEPTDAFEVAYEFKVQCQEVLRNLKSLKAPFVHGQIMSTPIADHVFFEHNGELACVPEECVFNGSIEPSALADPFTPEDLDLSVAEKRAMAEAMIEWNRRPVFTTSQSTF